jgi:hypothetical protein
MKKNYKLKNRLKALLKINNIDCNIEPFNDIIKIIDEKDYVMTDSEYYQLLDERIKDSKYNFKIKFNENKKNKYIYPSRIRNKLKNLNMTDPDYNKKKYVLEALKHHNKKIERIESEIQFDSLYEHYETIYNRIYVYPYVEQKIRDRFNELKAQGYFENLWKMTEEEMNDPMNFEQENDEINFFEIF